MSIRLRVWGSLALLLALAVGVLALAGQRQKSRRPGGGTPGPAEGGAEHGHEHGHDDDGHHEIPPFALRVVDRAGAPVTTATVLVARPEGSSSAEAGTWSPERATLSLPAADAPWSVRVQAPGYRLASGQGLRADTTLTLEPGLLVKVDAVLETEPAPGLVVYVQVNPVAPDGADLPPAERNALLALLDPAAPPPEGTTPLPREGFGLTLPLAQAREGIRFPAPGPWRLRWGLFHAGKGLWYALTAGSASVHEVRDEAEPQTVTLDVPADLLARTAAELEALSR
jgi:hypothetical protein